MTKNYELLIIGAGPAGLAAGIYAARYGMKAAILERGICGGQIKDTPFIENYLGLGKLGGAELSEKMKKHAQQFIEIKEFYEVTEIEEISHKGNDYLYLVKTTQGDFNTKGLLFATGVGYKKLGVKGEEEYIGRGVSYCATCDGFFFKEKKVAVVGGGSTALTEAIYLSSIGCETHVIHRRGQHRAEKALVDMAKESGVKFIFNTVVEEILGDGNFVKGLRIFNKETNEKTLFEIDGVFIAIGDKPNNLLSLSLGVEHDEKGYIKTDKEMRTSKKRVYAAGDITGGVRQVQTAAAEGVVATTTAYKEIKNPYWA